MKYHLKLWFTFAKFSLIRDLTYKGNFVLQLLIEILWSLVTIFTLEIIFFHTEELVGWTKAEVFLVYALFRITAALNAILFRKNIQSFSELVNQGELDFLLLKPVTLIFFVSTRLFSFERLSQLALGFAVLGYSVLLGAIKIDLFTTSMLSLVILLGTIIRFSIAMITNSFVFWTEKLDSLYRIEFTFTTAARYPRNVFPPLIKFLLSFIIPVLFIAAVPSEFLINPSSFAPLLSTFAMAAFLLLILRFIFYRGLKVYGSASS